MFKNLITFQNQKVIKLIKFLRKNFNNFQIKIGKSKNKKKEKRRELNRENITK